MESWFRSLWKIPRKRDTSSEKLFIGVLAFEVASLMSKLAHLWQSLSDKNIARLREEITNSMGIKKLVSEDEEYVVSLICAEMLENMGHVAKSVARLGKRCSDLSLKSFENTLENLLKTGDDPYGWQFASKKMERKTKKMERFVSVNASLYREMENLADLEQTLRRMKSNDSDTDNVNLLEFQKKFAWKQHEVKTLKQISLWNRTYDYTVLLLARSIFTIFRRIKHVFGIRQMVDIGATGDTRVANSDFIYRSQSVSALLQSSVYPYENGLPRFSSGPLGNLMTKPSPNPATVDSSNFYSGPLNGPVTKSSPLSPENRILNFHSGPIGRSTAKSGPLSGKSKTYRKLWRGHGYPSAFTAKKPQPRTNNVTEVGPFKSRMMSGNSSPVTNCHLKSNGMHSLILENNKDATVEVQAHRNILRSSPAIFSCKLRLLEAPPETLGAAALALHYANVIIVIEKLAASPHLIGHDARDDLYNMLPAKVRASLRARLKPYAKSLDASVYDRELAGEWSEAMTGILEWLAPLAHNTIRWQSERSFEQQSMTSKMNILLVQTLYFANQEKTEATITELLVGLNYIWRVGRELNTKALMECASTRAFEEYLDLEA